MLTKYKQETVEALRKIDIKKMTDKWLIHFMTMYYDNKVTEAPAIYERIFVHFVAGELKERGYEVYETVKVRKKGEHHGRI